eukprot:jgi/Botrbrau1/21274/Bobra.39_2s0063.1
MQVVLIAFVYNGRCGLLRSYVGKSPAIQRTRPGNLPDCLLSVVEGRSESWRKNRPEVIVVDGGSKDGTLAIARGFPCQGNISAAGAGLANERRRGKQASGDVLLFLHADNRLPSGFHSLMQAAWHKQTDDGRSPQWGCFRSIDLQGGFLGARLLEAAVGLRTCLFKLPYGDQGIFVKASTFWEEGDISPSL